MIVVLAIDALEYELVERFQCNNLKQRYYGKTDISEFSEPRTMVLWSSFMTGLNKEEEVLALGDQEMWNIQRDRSETFFDWFDDPVVIDLPGYSYDLVQHENERKYLKAFFDMRNQDEKSNILKSYNDIAFSHHKIVKKQFLDALSEGHDFVLGYFSLADVVGHLNFGNNFMMKMIYKDLDEIASMIKNPKIILSDHGMKSIGKFGDHSEYGFWSTAHKDLGSPRICDFPNFIKEMMEE